MAVTGDSKSLNHEPVSSLLVKTIVSALTFLSALSIRDTVTESITVVVPDNKIKKITLLGFLTMMFLFLTVLVAYVWQDRM